MKLRNLVLPTIAVCTKDLREKRNDASHKIVDNLAPGTQVMVVVKERVRKFDPRYEGPFTVV